MTDSCCPPAAAYAVEDVIETLNIDRLLRPGQLCRKQSKPAPIRITLIMMKAFAAIFGKKRILKTRMLTALENREFLSTTSQRWTLQPVRSAARGSGPLAVPIRNHHCTGPFYSCLRENIQSTDWTSMYECMPMAPKPAGFRNTGTSCHP